MVLQHLVPAEPGRDEALSDVKDDEVCIVLGEAMSHQQHFQVVGDWLQTVELGHLLLGPDLHVHAGV